MPDELHSLIQETVLIELGETLKRMRKLADHIADISSEPESIAFTSTVNAYQNNRDKAEKLEKIIEGLDTLSQARKWFPEEENGGIGST